jgi:hypothetical protein
MCLPARTEKGLQCLICAGTTVPRVGVKYVPLDKWSAGTAAPNRKRGEAEQHNASAKHLAALEAAKAVPALRHLLPPGASPPMGLV